MEPNNLVAFDVEGGRIVVRICSSKTENKNNDSFYKLLSKLLIVYMIGFKRDYPFAKQNEKITFSIPSTLGVTNTL